LASGYTFTTEDDDEALTISDEDDDGPPGSRSCFSGVRWSPEVVVAAAAEARLVVGFRSCQAGLMTESCRRKKEQTRASYYWSM
jgi:hypothetical protein